MDFYNANRDVLTGPGSASALSGSASALYAAIDAGRVESIRTLWELGARLPAWLTTTELHIASLLGREEVARFLIDSGQIVDPMESPGNTPLIHAARKGH